MSIPAGFEEEQSQSEVVAVGFLCHLANPLGRFKLEQFTDQRRTLLGAALAMWYPCLLNTPIYIAIQDATKIQSRGTLQRVRRRRVCVVDSLFPANHSFKSHL
jgi:hypothetical protein